MSIYGPGKYLIRLETGRTGRTERLYDQVIAQISKDTASLQRFLALYNLCQSDEQRRMICLKYLSNHLQEV